LRPTWIAATGLFWSNGSADGAGSCWQWKREPLAALGKDPPALKGFDG